MQTSITVHIADHNVHVVQQPLLDNVGLARLGDAISWCKRMWPREGSLITNRREEYVFFPNAASTYLS